MRQDAVDWHIAQRRNIRRMDDETLAKEVGFAEGFGPPTTTLEATWLDELRMEQQRRASR